MPDRLRASASSENNAKSLPGCAPKLVNCEPGNADLQAWRDRATALRERGVPTLPTTIAQERATNPFLRADSPAIHATLAEQLHETVPDRLTAFTLMREWKNRFR